MAYQGFLVKVGNTDISKYIEIPTFQVTPNQRTDLDTYRNGNNKLVREVSDHTITKIEFETGILQDTKMTELIKILEDNYTVPIERKLNVTYFDVTSGEYSTIEAYMPDYTPRLISLSPGVLYYNHMRLAFIEY